MEDPQYSTERMRHNIEAIVYDILVEANTAVSYHP